MLQHHTNLVTVKPPPVQPELSRCTRMCQRILWSNLLRYHGEAENPRMTIGVQSTNEERKCATRHNVFTLPPQDQPYVPTAQGPLNDKKGNGSIHHPIDQNGHANAIAFQQYGSHVGIAPWSCDVRKLGKTSVDHDVELDRFNNLKRLDLSVFSEIVSGSKFRLGTRNSTPATT